MVEVRRSYAGHNRQAPTPGVIRSLRPAGGVVHMIRLPGYGHHAVAQNPPHGLVRKAPQGIFKTAA